MNDTPTPRTDDKVAECAKRVLLEGGCIMDAIDADFARELERDLAAAWERAAMFEKAWKDEAALRDAAEVNAAAFGAEREADRKDAERDLAEAKKRIRELEEDRIIRQSPNDASYRAMAYRFAGWRFPDDFGPDGDISFKKPVPDALGNLSWPVGTNLLTVDQAEDMFRHCVPTVPQECEFHPDWSMLQATRESLREHQAELARVKAEQESDRKDAERYRWLRDDDNWRDDGPVSWAELGELSHLEFDAAIDAAIAAKGDL